MRKSIWFLPILILGFAVQALAVDLYSGVVPVPDKSVASREEATPAALDHVLQKLSGQWELTESPVLDQARENAAQMLLTFQYQEEERLQADGSSEKQLRLVASFIPASVDRLLRDAELPRWRPQRKPITVWVLIDDGRGRQLMPVEYEYAWERMSDIAELRGLPLQWPELDEEQLAEIDLQLLWGGYGDELPASDAGPESQVIIAARREGPEWNVRWTWTDTGVSSNWRTRNTDLPQALVEGTHLLTDHVVAANSIGPSGIGEFRFELLVAGLANGNDYARCMTYLQGLSLVDAVNVRSISPVGVVFDLQLNAAPDFLDQSLIQDGILTREPGDHEYRLAVR